jgi:hypothetical protein
VIVTVPVAPGLVVAGTGLRMPNLQLASLDSPTLVDQRSVSRAGSETTGSTFLEVVAPERPAVPVYPKKQARH